MDSWFMLTNAIQAILMNTESNWLYLDTLEDEDLTNEELVWLEHGRISLQNSFRSSRARFPTQINETLGDITGYGVGAIHSFYDPSAGGLSFSNRSLPEIFIDQDPQGVINRVYRRYMLKNQDAEDLFGKNTPDIVTRDNKAGREIEERSWLQCFEDNPDASKGVVGYNLMEEDEGKVVRTDNYFELPIHVGRWRVDSGQIYARGPGVSADAFARTLNEVVRTWIIQAQKAVAPPLLVSDDGVIQGPKTTPNAINIVSSYAPGNQEPIRPLISGSNFQVANEEIQRLQASIRKAYHHDILQITDSKELTAFHVQELAQRAQQWIAPVFLRMKVDLVQPLVQRAFRLSILNRLIDPMPESLREKGVRVVYISPAQRAQEASEAEATMRAVERVIALSEVRPSILDNYDFDKLARTIHRNFAADPNVLNSKKEVNELREAREAARAREQQERQREEAIAVNMAANGQAEAANVLTQMRRQ